MTGNLDLYGNTDGMGEDAFFSKDDEISYNYFHVFTTQFAYWPYPPGSVNDFGPLHFYRNTLYNAGTGYGQGRGFSMRTTSDGINGPGIPKQEVWAFNNNVIDCDVAPYTYGSVEYPDGAAAKADGWVNSTFNDLTTTTVGLIDTVTGKLKGDALQYQGRYGADISE